MRRHFLSLREGSVTKQRFLPEGVQERIEGKVLHQPVPNGRHPCTGGHHRRTADGNPERWHAEPVQGSDEHLPAAAHEGQLGHRVPGVRHCRKHYLFQKGRNRRVDAGFPHYDSVRGHRQQVRHSTGRAGLARAEEQEVCGQADCAQRG
uniref:(northern house mosquito) hypothetical protein n=1 Tax=Culex pipiens TaxID=7175 RepID=A0A8D8BC78_CULPI